MRLTRSFCPPILRLPALIFASCLPMLATLMLAGCAPGGQHEPGAGPATSQAQSAANPAGEAATAPSANGSNTESTSALPAKGEATRAPSSAATVAENPAVSSAEEAVRPPATVGQAAAVLDLTTFPLLPGAKPPSPRVVASLAYDAPADIKTAFEFQRRALLERKFQELAEPQIYEQSASGQFGRDRFVVSVSVFAGSEPGKVAVRLQNHSNVNLGKLPVPAGARQQYAFPGVASFITDAGAEETAAAVKQLLLDQGWQPYGSAGDSMHLKQNAVALNARVLSPPAQPGKTVIDYSATQMSADLPAPTDAISVQYADHLRRLDVDTPGSPDEVADWYKSALAPAGWKATTTGPVKDGPTSFLIFRNPEKDMLTLNLRDLAEEKQTRLSLEHQTAAEVEELDRQARLAMEQRRKKEEEKRNQPQPKIAIALPAAAQEVQATPQQIEFQLPSGSAKAALEDLQRQLAALQWQAEPRIGEASAGQLSFKSGEQSISILYVDPGLIPATITISGSGVELERKQAGMQ
jgi:hypothetical protein